MDKSIIQLVDTLPTDNITVKVLKAIDYVAPGQWQNLVGFDHTIQVITGETDPAKIERIRDRAVALYHDPNKGYQGTVKLYQSIDKADTVMATVALADKISEKIQALSFLGKITPKADTLQAIDLVLKITVEIIGYCKLNGLPKPNPKEFATALTTNYQDAALMRMIGLVLLDGVLPLGPDFLGKIHALLTGNEITDKLVKNPTFLAVNDSLPGNNPSDKLGFMTQSFEAVQGWMTNLVAKTGVTPQSISQHLSSFIEFSDDNLDVVAAFVDQVTNYYEHTGIQTVARQLILEAQSFVKTDQAVSGGKGDLNSGSFQINQTVEVWDSEEEDWYEATIEKVNGNEYYVHYIGYGSSYDEWIDIDDIRSKDHANSDDNGYAIGQKVKVWDEDQEEWYSAIIQKEQNSQYLVSYLGYDSSYDEWLDLDEIT